MRTHLFSTITLAITLPAYAENIQTVDVDAGLWEYAIVLRVDPGGVVTQETQQFCLSEAESNLTTNDLINQLSGDQCSSSNEVLTLGTGSADMTCVYPETNARGVGRLEVSYTSTSFDVDARATFTGPGGTSTAQLTGQGRRLGAC